MSSIYLLNFPDSFKPQGDMKKIKNIDNIEIKEDDIFMVYDFNSPLDARLKYYQIPFENLVIIAKTKKDLQDLIKKEKDNFRDDYAIFSGAKINTSNREIKRDILINLKLLSSIAYEMIEAGYLVEENRKKIRDWIISFEEPILKLFVTHHKIKTSNESIDIEEEFIINPQFRKMILIVMLKILANFVINNKLTTIDEITNAGGNWFEEKTWLNLKNKVKLF